MKKKKAKKGRPAKKVLKKDPPAKTSINGEGKTTTIRRRGRQPKFNIEGYDFGLKQGRARLGLHDMILSSSKSAGSRYDMIRFGAKFQNYKTMAAGRGTAEGAPPLVVVFDSKSSHHRNDNIEIKKTKNGIAYISEARVSRKIADAFGFALPEKPGISLKLIFNLRPLPVNGMIAFEVVLEEPETE